MIDNDHLEQIALSLGRLANVLEAAEEMREQIADLKTSQCDGSLARYGGQVLGVTEDHTK